jgi:hypothetical protein
MKQMITLLVNKLHIVEMMHNAHCRIKVTPRDAMDDLNGQTTAGKNDLLQQRQYTII